MRQTIGSVADVIENWRRRTRGVMRDTCGAAGLMASANRTARGSPTALLAQKCYLNSLKTRHS